MLEKTPNSKLENKLEPFLQLPEKTRKALKNSGMTMTSDPSGTEPQLPKDVADAALGALNTMYDELVQWFDTVSKTIILATTEVEAAEKQVEVVEAYLRKEVRGDKAKYPTAEDREAAVTLDDRRCTIVANHIFWKTYLAAQRLRLTQITQKRDRVFRELRRRENINKPLGSGRAPFGASVGASLDKRGDSAKFPNLPNLKQQLGRDSDE